MFHFDAEISNYVNKFRPEPEQCLLCSLLKYQCDFDFHDEINVLEFYFLEFQVVAYPAFSVTILKRLNPPPLRLRSCGTGTCGTSQSKIDHHRVGRKYLIFKSLGHP